jgi:hypothetical protein
MTKRSRDSWQIWARRLSDSEKSWTVNSWTNSRRRVSLDVLLERACRIQILAQSGGVRLRRSIERIFAQIPAQEAWLRKAAAVDWFGRDYCEN